MELDYKVVHSSYNLNSCIHFLQHGLLCHFPISEHRLSSRVGTNKKRREALCDIHMMKLLLQFSRKMCDIHFHMQLDETLCSDRKVLWLFVFCTSKMLKPTFFFKILKNRQIKRLVIMLIPPIRGLQKYKFKNPPKRHIPLTLPIKHLIHDSWCRAIQMMWNLLLPPPPPLILPYSKKVVQVASCKVKFFFVLCYNPAVSALCMDNRNEEISCIY